MPILKADISPQVIAWMDNYRGEDLVSKVKTFLMEAEELKTTSGIDAVQNLITAGVTSLNDAKASLTHALKFTGNAETVNNALIASIESIDSDIKFQSMLLALIKADQFMS